MSTWSNQSGQEELKALLRTVRKELAETAYILDIATGTNHLDAPWGAEVIRRQIECAKGLVGKLAEAQGLSEWCKECGGSDILGGDRCNSCFHRGRNARRIARGARRKGQETGEGESP